MNLKNSTLLQGGRYKIVRYISSGGFGCTYEGELVLVHKRVAIKEFFVRDFCNRDEQTSYVTVGTQSKIKLVECLQNKFLEEAGALYSMQHQNIVRVLDIFEENGTAYYVMDYVDGQSLHDIVREHGALPEQDVLKYVEQIADALEYVHSQNRLHLDIKPGNIMIDKLGKVKLIDFGASKQYDEIDGENTSTLLGKTPGYAPIEQMGNTVRMFTPATDIYALGATMYKCLTGNTPPDATLLMDEGLDPFPASVSEKTQKAVEKAMEVSKKNRPQTMDEFRALLFTSTKENESSSKPVVTEPNEHDEDSTQLSVEYINTEYDDDRVVDLGLSVKWCKYNFGAKRESDIGSYIGWGDLSGKQNDSSLNLYPSSAPPESICGNSRFDIATTMGKGWRLPTKKEQDELRMWCTWHWTTLDGVDGFKVTGKNGNSIFLPAAGWRLGYDYKGQDFVGYYWSGDLSKNPEEAHVLFFNQQVRKNCEARRYFGCSVRPVYNI